MTSLIQLAVRRPVAVTMAFTAVLVLGWLSWDRLGIDLLPDIDSPKVVVSLRSGDRSPEEMEERYGEVIEARLVTVRRMKGVSSVSRTGRILVTVEFHWDTDMDFALVDVQKAVGSLASDPDVDSLTVQRFDPRAAPIMTLGLVARSPDVDLDQLRRIGRDSVQRTLERIEGIAEARLLGGRTREVWVVPELYELKAFDLTPNDLRNRIVAANVDTPGGTVEDGATVYAVRGLGRFRDLADVARVTVGWREPTATELAGDGGAGRLVPVRLDEVADVRYGHREVQDMVFVDGVEGVGVSLYKESGANTVRVTERVHAVLEQLGADLPGVELRVVHEQARYIREAIREVEQAAAIGVVLAVLVLFAFLRRVAPTLVVAIAIPVSVITTLVLMFGAGLTLNVMSLGGLALGAGMLVDNAIVVVENTFRHLQTGRGRRDAAVRGAAEVAGAITAATLTTVVVFLPIVFVEGLAARLFEEQAFTVGFSLLASLAVALVLIPMLAARWFPERAAALDDEQRRYPWLRSVVSACLRLRWIVVVSAAALFALAIATVVRLGTDFLPAGDQGQFAIDLRLPEGSRVETTAAVVAAIEAAVRDNFGAHVRSVYAEVGLIPEDEHLLSEEATGENTATVRIGLTEPGERPSVKAIVAALDPFLATLPGLEVTYALDETGLASTIGAGGAPLVVEVRGRDLDELRLVTAHLRDRLAALPSLYNVVSSFQEGPPEIRLELDRLTAGSLGLDLDTIADEVRTRVDGIRMTSFQAADDERWVVLRFPEPRLDELAAIEMNLAGGAPVLLRDVVEPVAAEGPREILRRDQSRVGVVGAQIAADASFAAAVRDVREALVGVDLPPGYRTVVGGEEEQRRQTFAQLELAAGLAVLLIYMVLASLFESLVHPFTIMLTVPMALTGVVFGLALAGLPLGVMAAIGAIMLTGIAVNDSIVLVDRIGRLRDDGIDLREAILQATQSRLRPIVMTSLTTMLALAPMAVGIGSGAELRAPLAVAVIGGLVASTTLTLLVVPSLYWILDGLRPARVRGRVVGGGAPERS